MFLVIVICYAVLFVTCISFIYLIRFGVIAKRSFIGQLAMMIGMYLSLPGVFAWAVAKAFVDAGKKFGSSMKHFPINNYGADWKEMMLAYRDFDWEKKI